MGQKPEGRERGRQDEAGRVRQEGWDRSQKVEREAGRMRQEG